MVAGSTRQLKVVHEALEVVLRRLAALPLTPEVFDLRARAEKFKREAEGWATAKPTVEAREKLMKRVLKLHVDVSKIEPKP
jgi:hypothetical protein